MENRVLLDVLSVCEDFWKMLSGQREQSALLFVSFFSFITFHFSLFFFNFFFFLCKFSCLNVCVRDNGERERDSKSGYYLLLFISLFFFFFFFVSLGLWIDCLYYSPLSFILH